MEATQLEYDRALKTFMGLCRMHDLLSDPNDPIREVRIASFNVAVDLEVPPGLYEHFKSKDGDSKYYLVDGATIEVNRHTGVVKYASLYGTKAGMWAHRDLLTVADGFLSPINREEYVGPRFKLIRRLTPRQILDILGYVSEIREKAGDRALVRVFVEEILTRKVPRL